VPPRHRAIKKIVICFECGAVRIFFSDRKDHGFSYVSDSARNEFDAAWKNAKLPIAPRHDEKKKPTDKK
jgi:hypothetical protein